MTALVWDRPVRSGGYAWFEPLVPHWAWILALMEPVRQDVLGVEDWEGALTLFDAFPPPLDAEGANLRWRAFVVLCWQAWERWRVRVMARPGR